MIYAIYFIPHLKKRKELSKLRTKLCRKYKSNKALQYPLHMTLTIGVQIKNYPKFEKEIRDFCKTQKSRVIKTKKYTDVLKDVEWCGIHLIKGKWLIDFQKNIQKIVDKYSINKKQRKVPFHMTLVYGTDLKDLSKFKVPINKFTFDRITLVKKDKRGERYRVHKHINLK